MIELVDSSPDIGDPELLRRRFAEEGYLFFRQVLDPSAVTAAGCAVRTALVDHGWLTDTEPAPRVVRRPCDWDDFLDTYRTIQSAESVHRVASLPPAPELAATLVGEHVFAHPGKVVRAGFPQPLRETEPHQDYLIQQGSPRTVTCWVPLADCPPELGGLQVMPGSHLGGLREPVEQLGRFYFEMAMDDPRWASTAYQVGDLLMFHALTIHSSLVNTTERIRLSMDFRFQPISVPIRSGLVMPHMYPKLPAWSELTEGWSTTKWVDVPLEAEVEFTGRQTEFQHIRLQLAVAQTREGVGGF